ncbi:MAG: hypothetical protein M1826_003051 [Phylliscum demangeonii]|nr:MAG: hypothetical protein M1826_003051 [Phylliscum demangeonii]
MPFAQIIVGPPGSGKSTYCNGMHQFLSAIGRKCSIVNLDAANERTTYPCALDIRDLVTLEEIMAREALGPNGGTLYAVEELECNFEWLQTGLKSLGEDYVLFDCPGQVEIFTHHASLRNVLRRVQKMGYRLVALHLVDSYCLTLPSLYLSTLLLSLRAMLQLDLPHLNVLTKIDRLASYAPLPFNLDFYAEVQDLSYLLPHLARESPSVLGSDRFQALNQAIIGLVQDFGLVAFETLAVEEKASMMNLLRAADRAVGYAFGPAEGANDTVWQVAMREAGSTMEIRDVQERWLDHRDRFDAAERSRWQEEGRAAAGDGDANVKADGEPDDGGGGEEAFSTMPTAAHSGITVVRKPRPSS